MLRFMNIKKKILSLDFHFQLTKTSCVDNWQSVRTTEEELFTQNRDFWLCLFVLVGALELGGESSTLAKTNKGIL